MISNREKLRKAKYKGKQWHYLAVKKLSSLLRGIMSKHFYFLNCFHSFRTKNKFQSLKEVCKNKDFLNTLKY